MKLNNIVDTNDFRERMNIGYNRILDELDFIQRVCELHGIPSEIAERMTEKAFGVVSDCKSDIANFIERVESYAKYEETNADGIGGITRVNK